MAAALYLNPLIGKFLGPQLKQLCDADDETRRLKDFLARYNSHFGKDQVGFEIAVISEEALSPSLTHMPPYPQRNTQDMRSRAPGIGHILSIFILITLIALRFAAIKMNYA